MITKIFPLWFVDIMNTEEKLSEMSANGYRLVSFDFLSGKAGFEEASNEALTYKIRYQKKCGGNAPKGTIKNGWTQVCGDKDHYIICTAESDAVEPSYQHYKSLVSLLTILVLFVLCFFLGFIVGAAMSALDNETYDVFLNPTMIVFCIISAVLIFITVYLTKCGKKLRKTDPEMNLKGKLFRTIPEENFIYTREEEKEMIKNGQMKKVTKFMWTTYPDKIETWVSEEAEKGWKFYRMSETGNAFFFIKTEPCHISFAIDYQNVVEDSYIINAKEDGWKQEFISVTRITAFIIWSKEYSDEDEVPEFYSDPENKYSYAKKMSLTIGGVFIADLIIYALILIEFWDKMTIGKEFAIFLCAACITMLIEYGIMTFGYLAYFIRMRRKYKNG